MILFITVGSALFIYLGNIELPSDVPFIVWCIIDIK